MFLVIPHEENFRKLVRKQLTATLPDTLETENSSTTEMAAHSPVTPPQLCTRARKLNTDHRESQSRQTQYKNKTYPFPSDETPARRQGRKRAHADEAATPLRPSPRKCKRHWYMGKMHCMLRCAHIKLYRIKLMTYYVALAFWNFLSVMSWVILEIQ